MIAPELEKPEFTIGENYTRENKSLKHVWYPVLSPIVRPTIPFEYAKSEGRAKEGRRKDEENTFSLHK
jgi:hypothetical protein